MQRAVEGQAVSGCPTQISLASEPVAAEIGACSDIGEDEEAFWSELFETAEPLERQNVGECVLWDGLLSQGEAQHAESLGSISG
jgi:hypothetical protein